ncbi:MAG TPA: transposase [Gaiellaceae bacterium]
MNVSRACPLAMLLLPLAKRDDADERSSGYGRPMARRPRNALPANGAFHVTNRGVEQRRIYLDDSDRLRFIGLLDRAARRFSWRLSAYALMTNHFHLVVLADLEQLSRGMHQLSFRYAQGFNDRYERVGHLFQGRFKASSIESSEYYANACAYVFENPVRAGICAEPSAYRWLGGELFGDIYRRV